MMVKDIKIMDIEKRKDIIFQNVPDDLVTVVFTMLDNWNKTPENRE